MAMGPGRQSEIGELSLEEEELVEDHEEANEEHGASANSENTVDPDDSKAGTKKKTKKKKKKKKVAGARDNVTMPTQALVELAFPWTAVNRPNIGRCAISTRDIKAGEVVIAEQAVAFIPRCQDRLAVCHFCCRDVSGPGSSFECRGCRYSVYCQDCKVEAMEEHKRWCHVSSTLSKCAKASDCDEELLRFVLSLALQRHPIRKACEDDLVNGCLKEGTVKDGTIYPVYEDAICLKTHTEKVTAGWKASVKKGCQLLYEKVVEAEGASDKVNFTPVSVQESTADFYRRRVISNIYDLESLAALVNTNSHGMGAHGSGIHNTDVAVGIFPFVSILNHSCRPNCCFASDGRVMYVRATQDIPKDTQLCVSYINLYEPRGTRRMQLAAAKHFLCRCQRCSEPFGSSFDRFLEGCLCTVRGCGGVVVKASSYHEQDSMISGTAALSKWECDQCSRVLDPNTIGYSVKTVSLGEQPWILVATAERRLSEAMNVYRERRFKDARVLLEHYVAEFTGKLHELHVLLFDALTPLMNCCRALGDAAEGSRVCRIILNCMKKVIPGISLELANFYFCLGEMYQERSEACSTNMMIKHYRKLAQEALQHVRVIRETCLGKATLPG